MQRAAKKKQLLFHWRNQLLQEEKVCFCTLFKGCNILHHINNLHNWVSKLRVVYQTKRTNLFIDIVKTTAALVAFVKINELVEYLHI